MSSDADIHTALRRIKPQKRFERLHPRGKASLPYIERLAILPPLLLDTTVYIDQLNGRLPAVVDTLLRSASLWHSTVTEGELVTLTGLLDPSHPATSTVLKQVVPALNAARHIALSIQTQKPGARPESSQVFWLAFSNMAKPNAAAL